MSEQERSWIRWYAWMATVYLGFGVYFYYLSFFHGKEASGRNFFLGLILASAGVFLLKYAYYIASTKEFRCMLRIMVFR